jgi:hypothetical protein
MDLLDDTVPDAEELHAFGGDSRPWTPSGARGPKKAIPGDRVSLAIDGSSSFKNSKY